MGTSTIGEFNGAFRFLSNFWKEPIEFEGLTYPTTENAYQAAKTENHDMRWAISQMSPADAKKAGRGLKLRDDWDDIKLAIMERLLAKKFRNGLLRSGLINTSPGELIEGNYWHDNFWGNCTCERCKDIPGANHLGRLLMELRASLITEGVVNASATPSV